MAHEKPAVAKEGSRFALIAWRPVHMNMKLNNFALILSRVQAIRILGFTTVC